MSTIRIKGDTSGYIDLSAGSNDGALDISSSVTGAPVRTHSDLELETGGIHVKNPAGIEGLIVDEDTTNAGVSGRIVLKNSTDASSVYYSNTLGWTFHTGTILGTTSGTQRMYLTPEGYQRLPYQPSFKAGLNTNTSVTTFDNIIFNATSGEGRYNTGGHYSTSNGRFTAPVSGAYHFDVGLLYGPSVPDGTNFDDCAFLYLNGALAAYDERRAEYVNGTTGNSGYYGTWIHTQLYMNSGDYVSVVNYNRFAGVHGNDKFTWFAGFLIG